MVTGVEATGIVLAVIPLTLQCYAAVRELASQYSGYNRAVHRILADIATYEGLLKAALDQLLADVIEEESRKIMLANLGSEREYWHRDGLEDEFRNLLGDLFQPVINSIRGAHETLENIQRILLKLGSEGIPRFRRIAMIGAAATSPVLTNPPQPPMRDIQIQSSRVKVMSIIKGTQGKLKALRNDLKSHNDSVIQALQLRQSNSNRKRQRPDHTTANAAICLPRECLNARAMQLASRKLFGLTREALFCDCHQFHLRLDYRGNEPLSLESASKGKSTTSATTELETRFSFQMTARSSCSGELKHLVNQHTAFHLVFTGCDSNAVPHVSEERTSGPTICQEILSSSDGYRRYFQGQDGSNCSFVLQRSPALKIENNDPEATTSISLDHLVASRPTDLSHFDQLLIAAHLASSVLLFYSTPWLRNWCLHKVHFFEKQEQPILSPGLWTPYLFLSLDNPDQSQFRKNGEIYSLGLVLLGLGRKKRIENSAEGMHSILEQALTDVFKRMGADYYRFVRNCLYVWGDQNLDFMEERTLESFLFEITVLHSRSRGFNPGFSQY